MGIKEKRKVADAMLKNLGEEHNREYGFNEYSQFCEDTLKNIIQKLNEKQLSWLMTEIENASCLSICREDF